MSNEQNNSTELDSLLDMTLDDLSDLPEFKVYPVGTHRVSMSMATKKINEHPAMEVKFKYISMEELADPAVEAPAAGTESSVAFFLDNEIGQGQLKAFAKPLAEHFGTGNMRELVAQTQDAEVIITTKIRQNKEKTQSYLNVVSVSVA